MRKKNDQVTMMTLYRFTRDAKMARKFEGWNSDGTSEKEIT